MTGYDKNDNVLSSQCYGQTSASVYALIILTGNLLNHVDDTATTSAYNNGFEFKDGVKQANEYVYDANGNLTKDLNKGISNITYNVLNLPTGVTFASGGFIQYGYTADGIKRRMMYKEADGSGNPVPTVYCCNVVYENSVGRLLLTEEGYVTLSDKKYHYYLQDHQGNNRVVLSSSGAVEEANHYYPFGGVQGIMMRHWVGLRLMTDLMRSIIRCLRISMGLIIVVQKSLNKAGIETMNKMRVINRQTGDIFNVKVNPYLPSKAYQAIEKNNPLGYIIRRNK